MKKITSILLVLIMALSFGISSVSVSAANVCYDIRGDLSKTVTFKVNVGKKILSSEKIVLTQSKGNTRQTWYTKVKNVKLYGKFYVSVYDDTAKKWVYSNKEWQSKTFTIKSSKLKKNHSYTITVKGKLEKHIFDGYDATPYVFDRWLSYPTWSVTKTGKNINFCGY